jgi:ribose transport system ATP-binding protein
MALIEVEGLAKRYGSVVALRDANLSVEAGQVHALLGANGAGKSTLVKMLAGVIRPDGGRISFNGCAVRISSPASARRIGIASVFQDSALVPDLTVGQNLRLTRTPVKEVERWLAELDVSVDISEQVSLLPLPTIRMLDFAVALARNPQLLILDELTAALPADLAARVFEVVRSLGGQQRSALFITHRLAEVVAVCDRATILRDGGTVESLDPSQAGSGRIVEAMLGPTVAAEQRQAAPEEARETRAARRTRDQAPAVVVSNLTSGGILDETSFELHEGEVLGVAALEGQGQERLFECLAGLARPDSGEIRLKGRPLTARSPFDAIKAGLVLVPGDRLEALLPKRPVSENIASPRYNHFRRWGPINLRDERNRVGNAITRLSIDMRAQSEVRRLSGGNQQKVAIARWLATGFQTMLCFDPTRGIDVGAKAEIYRLLRDLAQEGRSILLFTSELTEIPFVCDRVIVLYHGKVVAEMPAHEATEANLLHAAHGLGQEVLSA